MKQSNTIGRGSVIGFLLLLGVFLSLELPRVQAASYDCSAQSAIPESECDALVALYNSTNGGSWTHKAYWLNNSYSPCDWYGVNCTSGHVTKLDLKENNLDGSLPASIGDLSEVSHLYLSKNQLSGLIPDRLGDLNKLYYLDLYQNQLSGSIPDSIGNLSVIAFLLLHNNQLSGYLPKEMGQLTTLSQLGIGHNPLIGSIPASFTNLTNLVWFLFDGSSLCEPSDSSYQTWKASVLTYIETGYTCQNLYVRSAGGYDGKVIESSENSNMGGSFDRMQTSFMVGDTNQDQQVKSILHFNTETLPNTAVIGQVTLRVKVSSILGSNPFDTHGYLIVDVDKPYFGTGIALEALDFQDTPDLKIACTLGTTASGWYLCSLKEEAVQHINKYGYTQFRLRFQTGDNDDTSADLLYFYSGDVATANFRPILTVTYYVP